MTPHHLHLTFATKIYIWNFKAHKWKFASESNSFLSTCLAFSLLTQTQPCSSSARLHVFISLFSAFSLSSRCLYQWSYPVFHSSTSILRYNTYLTAGGTHTAAASESWSHSRHPAMPVLVSPSLPQLHCSIILSHFVTFRCQSKLTCSAHAKGVKWDFPHSTSLSLVQLKPS